MDDKKLKAYEERLRALEAQVSGKTDKYIDPQDWSRPTIITPSIKVYETDAPLLEFMESQNVRAIPMSVGRLYKVIDDLGPVYTDPTATGAITPEDQTAGDCAERIECNVCQRDFKAFRVAVEACLIDTDVDVRFVPGRDGIPDGNPATMGEERDVKLGEAMRQAKDFLLAQGLGNAAGEPESLETLINQMTTPNIIDNVGQTSFEFSIIALLAQVGLTTLAHSYLRNQDDMWFVTHPMVELTMSKRASLPGLDDLYSLENTTTGQLVRFMGIPVFADRNIAIDDVTGFTSIFLLRRDHIGIVQQYTTDREVRINEEIDPSQCEEDCLRLKNYITGLSRGVAKMGRVINVKPMLFNTIVSGLTGQLNNPNAGTTLGGI